MLFGGLIGILANELMVFGLKNVTTGMWNTKMFLSMIIHKKTLEKKKLLFMIEN